MSTLPTSTQLGNTSIVKYIDDDETTSRDCTPLSKEMIADAKNSH